MKSLPEEFGQRLITLHTGAPGLRGGLHCDVLAVDGPDPVMDFIASDATLDRYNEVITPDGWQLDNFRANPVIPDCHNYSSIAKILGRAKSISVSGGKLINRVAFCTDNPMGNMAYKMAKGGFIRSQSVGFIPLEWQNGIGKDQPARTYTKTELLEVSLVVVPANPAATIGLALKSGALDKADIANVIAALRACASEPDDPNEGAVTFSDRNSLLCFLDFLAGARSLLQQSADLSTHARASGTGVNDAHLLQLARDLSNVLKRT